MPATALSLHILLGLASFAWQAANRFRGLRLIEFELDVVHFDIQPTVLVLANFYPLILPFGCLFKVNNVVSRWAISVRVKIKLITGDNNSLFEGTIAPGKSNSHPVRPWNLTFRRYRSRSEPLVGRIASHSPGRPEQTSWCISLPTMSILKIVFVCLSSEIHLKAYAKAMTASLTNWSWSSKSVLFLDNFSFFVHGFLYFLLNGVKELLGYLHSKWASQNSTNHGFLSLFSTVNLRKYSSNPWTIFAWGWTESVPSTSGSLPSDTRFRADQPSLPIL